MLKSLFTIGAFSFLLAGCADSTSDQATETEMNGTEEVNGQSGTAANEEVLQEPLVVTQPENAASNAQAEVALNPPHGEPGHDCDIAVGAPLDGSGGQNIQPAQPALQPVSAQKPIMQVGSEGDARLNPPHGQPGHDCDVAVGAPLPAK